MKLQHPAPLRPVGGFDIGSLLGTAGTIAGASSGVPGASAVGGSLGSSFGSLFGGSSGGGTGSGASSPTTVTTTTSTQVNPNFSINVGSSGSTFSASGSGQSAQPGSVDQYGNPVASTTTLSTNQKYILIGGAVLLAVALFYSYSNK